MKTRKFMFIGMMAVAVSSVMFTGCAKEGCTNTAAKNYDVEAEEDDGTCELYTNTEFLTMSAWKYSSTTPADTDFDSEMSGFTITCKADKTYSYTNGDGTDTGTGTWAFNSGETTVTFTDNDTSSNSDPTVATVVSLDIDAMTLKMTMGDGGEKTVNYIH